MRSFHANGASLFFICLYLHTGRGLYYNSYSLMHPWIAGTTILLLVIASAFLGYVLPWGQISFWGASVITGLIQAVPYLGRDIIKWLWGGFSVDSPTLVRFFSFHFLVPFIVAAVALIHIALLHSSGSSNPLGLGSNYNKVEFHKEFSMKDYLGVCVILTLFTLIVLIFPWDLGDPENFNVANPMVAPVHIQPEWYFLFAYSILRSIPNKLGGVIALAASVIVLYVFPFIDLAHSRPHIRSVIFKIFRWGLVGTVILLTWIGARPVEDPYLPTGQFLTTLFFLIIASWPIVRIFNPFISLPLKGNT